jgi:nucleoid DNA-binding protein
LRNLQHRQTVLRVAIDLGLPQKVVRAVVAAYVDELKRTIVDEQWCAIPEFGTFSLSVARGDHQVTLPTTNRPGVYRRVTIPTRLLIRFKKALKFRRQLQERFNLEDDHGRRDAETRCRRAAGRSGAAGKAGGRRVS